MRVRASIGTLGVLGILNIKSLDPPSTGYLLLSSSRGCTGTCTYCSQSRNSTNKKFLGRIVWPEVELEEIVENVKISKFKRICIQTILKERFVEETCAIVRTLRENGYEGGISVATTPISKSGLLKLLEAGVERIGVGLDVATPELALECKKPYPWSLYLRFARLGVEILGRSNVTVHVIIGLGESEESLLNLLNLIYKLGCRAALFPYTPRGRMKPSVEISKYRVFQVVNHLLNLGFRIEDIVETVNGRVFIKRRFLELISKDAFLTSGCPDCNRPYYNESPRGPIYNYPNLDRISSDYERVLEQLRERVIR